MDQHFCNPDPIRLRACLSRLPGKRARPVLRGPAAQQCAAATRLLGRGRAGRAGRAGASGAPVGGEGVRVSAGEERRARRRRSGRPAADGSAARGVDRPTADPGAARAGPAPGQAGRAALGLQGQVHAVLAGAGSAGADDRPVRRDRARQLLAAAGVAVDPVPGRVAAAADRRPGLRDRPVRRGWSAAGCAPTPATGRSKPSPGSGRCWPRCSSPRSATSPGSTDPQQLACWAGLTPKHHESDTTVHRGRITKQGSRLVRWAAVEAVQRVPAHTRLGRTPRPGRGAPRPQHRRRRRRPRADHAGVLRAARSPHPLPACPRTGGGVSTPRDLAVGADRAGHDPRAGSAWSPLLIDLAHREPCRSAPCRPTGAAKG